jgi:D-xylose transport system substrate-binding protein
MRVGRPTIASAVAVLGISVTVAACGSGNGSGSGSASTSTSKSSGGKKIALLLPEHTTARYETQDRPHFESMVKSLCATCSVVYENANQDASEQQSQADSVLTQGIDAMVLDPVDATSASTIVAKAKAQNVPVISYDRLVSGANLAAYISFDNERVGVLQATALEKKLTQDGKAKGPIVMLNGDATDNNAHLFEQGANSVFSKDGVKIAKSYDTQGYTAANAQTELQQAITALGNNGFAGVYDANDGIASGAITAMKDAGINPASRPTTGQDAELDGIQRILADQQYMTVYKAVKSEANDAARLAVALAKGQPLPANLINQDTKSGTTSVPSVILTPVAVTKANVASTVIKDGFWTPAEVCTSAFASACKAAGIAGA